jgi:superfamily I DNA/RNA helicase
VPSFDPTPQQTAILDAVATGETVVVEALAGTGKTSSLDLIARAQPQRKMSYVGFNRAIVEDGMRRFPRNVVCRTAHSFALQAVRQERPELLERLSNTARVPNWKVADLLRIPAQFTYGNLKLRDRKLAGLVKEGVSRFCKSTAEQPQAWMLPSVPGMDTPEARTELQAFLFPYLTAAWEDLISDNGSLAFTHDVYLKLFSMLPAGQCVLPGNMVLFDESQDADPVILYIIQRQQEELNSQVIYVGDENQSIYEWRGAINAMAGIDTPHRLPLTKSFRFGSAIAEEANRILSLLPTELRLEGHEPVGSQLAILDNPDMVLCRTNAEAIARLLMAQVAGVKAGLVGGTTAVEKLAQAALDLSEGRETYHPELQAFSSWAQVQDYVKEEKEARDLEVLVRLVDTHGADALLQAVERAVPEQAAELCLSTAHKAKGREWDRVAIATDFPYPMKEEGGLSESELRLAYVAVTRAKKFLDSSSLSWIGSVARRQGAVREFLPADQVPAVAARKTVEVAQVMVDPESTNRVIMTGTKYDPALVEAQKELASDLRPSYRAEWAGFSKVRVVLATYKVLKVVEKFNLTITDEARERIEQFS